MTKQAWRTLSNEEINSMWQILPHKIEMILRRVQYYQRWIQEPEAHAQLILAMFGICSFEHRNQMLADGSIDTVIAHPWLLQLMDDIDFVVQKLDDLSLDSQIIASRFHLLFVKHEPGRQLALICEHSVFFFILFFAFQLSHAKGFVF